ncbi:hypothetical protein M1V86_23775, partial [Klebsiella pneumoniae]|nr:hypothetical protein [Klebsiella pneumoniae]MDY9998651.1 hypothetical protein [Klebsiella pneumoniae]
QEGQQTETEATGAPQKHHYTLNQQVGSITHKARLRFFVPCVLLHLNGGPDGGVARRAGVSEAGKVNLVRFHRQ